jgi:3-methylfumaryl-CoA hydratase
MNTGGAFVANLPELDVAQLQSWVGRSEETHDLIAARRAAQMAGSIGLSPPPASGNALPLPWHWVFFTPVPQPGATGADGHPARGGFLPPVPLPRRMWAGGRIVQHQPLRIDAPARRVSTVAKVEAKTGRAGALLFVTVEHALFSASGDLALEERQDIVYREPATANTTERPAATDRDLPTTAAQWEEAIIPDAVLLFRYSALTFNGHRIHYDQPYATGEEGYPGLVVHGPLIATLLLQRADDALGGVELREFSFRARRPLFADNTAYLCGAREGDMLTLWALTPKRELAMRIDARLADTPSASNKGED